ncbi:biliverdin-producing heme oxygenase [Sphingomonas koreensis]
MRSCSRRSPHWTSTQASVRATLQDIPTGAQHWREFTAALDALELNHEADARAAAGADAAFARVQALVDAAFVR